jgi:hypothetical protein
MVLMVLLSVACLAWPGMCKIGLVIALLPMHGFSGCLQYADLGVSWSKNTPKGQHQLHPSFQAMGAVAAARVGTAGCACSFAGGQLADQLW